MNAYIINLGIEPQEEPKAIQKQVEKATEYIEANIRRDIKAG